MVGVRRIELADELPEDEVDVPAGDGILHQLAVAGAQRRPVDAVHVRDRRRSRARTGTRR